ERAPLEHAETLELIVRLYFADNADLITILEIAAHAGQVAHHFRHTHFFQVLAVPDPGQHQQLRGIEGAACQDDFAVWPHVNIFLLDLVLLPWVAGPVGGSCLVYPLLETVVNSPGALVLDVDLRDQSAGNEVQPVRVEGPDGKDALADTGADAVED